MKKSSRPNGTDKNTTREDSTSSTSAAAYRQHTPIRDSNIVVPSAQNRNISEVAKQLKNNDKMRNAISSSKSHTATLSHHGTGTSRDSGINNGVNSSAKKKVHFPYPRFSRTEYQQQLIKDSIRASEDDADNVKPSDHLSISNEDIDIAFRFFDVHKRGKLTAKDLKHRLKVFYPHMSNNEYKFLIGDEHFTVDKLKEILSCEVGTNFDPYKEAFKVFDPQESGYVDIETLSTIMGQLGYGAISKEDQEVLIKTADIDGDGRVSLDDFKNMLNPEVARERKETVMTQEVRANSEKATPPPMGSSPTK